MAAYSHYGRLLFVVLATACILSAAAASPQALSEADKKAAAQLLIGYEESIDSLEGKYQLLRSFEVLGISREELITCDEIGKVLTSSNSSPKDLFYASKIGESLQCSFTETELKVTASNLQSYVSSSDTLMDLRLSIGALAVVKNWIKDDLVLENAVAVFHKIKALADDEGTSKYEVDDDRASPKAAGFALETLAYLINITSPALALDDAKIRYVKGAASKLFDHVERYEDSTHYFAERSVDTIHGGGGPLAATSCVVKGVTAVASAISGQLEISAEKFVGVAKFFLIAGVQGSPADMFHVLDALGALDKNSFFAPVILSVHPLVLSLTAKDILKVSTTTALGSPVAATVTLRKAVKATEKNPVLTNEVLESGDNEAIHRLDLVDKKFDIGTYDLTFKVKVLESGKYAAETFTTARILVTGVASVAEVEIGVLDSDTGSADFMKRWDPSTKEVVSLFATHLQKLNFVVDVLSPFQEPFKPHQVFVKLTHESQVQHLFLMKPSGKKLELSLDLLGLVEKLNYLSGLYTIELVIGDAAMENPVMWSLGTVELDLPEAPEGVAKPSSVTQAPSKYGPKPEIHHVFRPADKRAPPTLANSFLLLSLGPLLGFLIGLKVLNVNTKSFPSSGLPMLAALLFHVGIASILGLYVLFWLKLNLFQTLKFLGVLATLLTVPGYYLLSHLANSPSGKVKSA